MDEKTKQNDFQGVKLTFVPKGALVKLSFLSSSIHYKLDIGFISALKIIDLNYLFEVLDKFERQFCLSDKADEEKSHTPEWLPENSVGIYLGSLNASYKQGYISVYRAILIGQNIYIIHESNVQLVSRRDE